MKLQRNFLILVLFGAACLGTLRPSYGASDPCGVEYACHEALVKFSRHADDAHIDQVFAAMGAEEINYFPRSRVHHILLPNSPQTLVQIANLKNKKYVLIAEPNWVVSGEVLPDDTHFNLLWGLNNTGQTGGTPGFDIGMDEIWDQFTDGSGVIIAVIDSGVDYTHPDLEANMWNNPDEIPDNGIDDDGNGLVDDVYGWDFRNNDNDPMDDNKHGTHVAGIAGAVGNNGEGVVGVSWTAKIMVLKFLNSSASGLVSDAIPCIEYALSKGAKILNNSWGGGSFDSNLVSAILESDSEGVIFAAAAGNQGRDTDASPFYPASYGLPNIISVASTTHLYTLSGFSNYGAVTVDLGGPGSAVYSTYPNNSYGYISGTSMATPHVAGAAALLWTQFPTLNHRQIIHLLYQGVEEKGYLDGKSVTGGVLNIPNSLALATNPGNHPPVANAGADQMKAVGDLVTLQGSATDEDGDFPLIFEWELSVPAGSKAKLDDPLAQNPSFLPDKEGDFSATLIVYDFLSSSFPDRVDINIDGFNVPQPTVVVRAFGTDPQTGASGELTGGIPAMIGEPILLDGSESSSIFPDQLLIDWKLVAVPSGSTQEIQDFDQDRAFFTPLFAGTYTIRLTIEDGFGENFGEISLFVVDPNGNKEVSPTDPEDTATGEASSNASGGCRLSPKATGFGASWLWIAGEILFALLMGISFLSHRPIDKN